MERILFYIDCMQMGGANRVIANLANHYSGQGKDVILVNDTRSAKDTLEYNVDSCISRFFLDQMMKPQSSWLERTINRMINLRKIVKTHNPDIVVSFMGPPNFRLLLSTIGLRTIKVVSVRNDPYKEYGVGIKKIVARLVFLLADGCVFQTQQASKYFTKKTRKKSRIIYNPVRDSFYNVEYIGDTHDIVVIGRLQAQKNPLLALNAFARISNRYPMMNLKYYGIGELDMLIIKRAQELGISNRVHLCGQTNSVETVLRDAMLFMLPSNYEGMPNALMEAMAVGVPSIVTDCPCGGAKELLIDSNNGRLVRVGDEIALSEALNELISDSHEREVISSNAKKRALEFRPSVILKQWDDYFDNLQE